MKRRAFWGQALKGTSFMPFGCLLETGVTRHMPELFRSPARASRALAVDAVSVTSPVCRLPASLKGWCRRGSLSASGSPWLFGRAWISLCTDRGQAPSVRPLVLIRTHPSPHTGRIHKVLEGSLKNRSATGKKPYSKYTTKQQRMK